MTETLIVTAVLIVAAAFVLRTLGKLAREEKLLNAIERNGWTLAYGDKLWGVLKDGQVVAIGGTLRAAVDEALKREFKDAKGN